MNKVVVLFSGGLDSTVLLYTVNKKYEIPKENIYALNIHYGQRHAKEVSAAKTICDEFGVQLISIDTTSLFQFDTTCSLLSSGPSLPTGTYKQQQEDTTVVSTYVPFRNGLFLSIATSIALQLNCDTILYGAHMDDLRAAYPDCSTNFVLAMSDVITSGTENLVKLLAPWIGLNKSDIVARGLELEVPFNLTWSCYSGEEVPCGKCATCIDRAKAFAYNQYEELSDGSLQTLLT